MISVMKTQLFKWMPVGVFFLSASAARPALLDDQFDLPRGFHIYKVAEGDLTGGSYAMTFDGHGRLLVGDGQNTRRLVDSDGDQVYDTYEIIAEGLGGRGPQGLLVSGDYLYAVGGGGVQLFSGYAAGGKLAHEGRLGESFNTGGDHAAHTLLRGLDGYVYLVSGDGGGVGERNPPSLGMNYLGEFFSLDSDMEWHVDLPFYRPVRLNHWATGSDNGWQGVGAYPSYYLDCLPGILEVGRGSPNWGLFYEHTQFPNDFLDSFIVCDYLWKSATSGGYASSGRLLSFGMTLAGSHWEAEMQVLAQPKAGAELDGRPINSAVVDVAVAPDGSLLITEHNQGVWRLFYDADATPTIPAISPESIIAGSGSSLEEALAVAQPMAEWSRLWVERTLSGIGGDVVAKLVGATLDTDQDLRARLRALRYLTEDFEDLPTNFIEELATDPAKELRAQAAWLVGIRGKSEEVAIAVGLLEDEDPFVRRRACESFTRHGIRWGVDGLIARLDDEDRYVRYAAMTALARFPGTRLAQAARRTDSPAAIIRLLCAAELQGERPRARHIQGALEDVLSEGWLASAQDSSSTNSPRVLIKSNVS